MYNKNEGELTLKDPRTEPSLKDGLIDLVIKAAVAAALAFVLFGQVFLVTQAKGVGMYPSVKDGDVVVAFRMQRDWARGDAVVYRSNGERHIGRIVARESDLVDIREVGTILVNGAVQEGEILYPTYPAAEIDYPYVVPEGCFFVLGDFRTNALDSRELGPVREEDLEGKAVTVLRRRSI